jgi:hypothetical protein
MAEQEVIVKTDHMLSGEIYGRKKSQFSEHFETLQNEEPRDRQCHGSGG